MNEAGMAEGEVDDRTGLCQQAGQSFAHAAAARGLQEGCFRLGTEILQIKAAGGALFAVVSSALSHLRLNSGGVPGLTLHVWENDSASEFQLRPGDAMSDGQSVELRRRAEDGGSFSMARVDDGVLYVADFQCGEAFCAIDSLENWPSWESAAPFRILMGAWLGQKGFFLAHASCVGLEGRALLLAGPGGSGKSTTALACARDGWLHYADDYTLLQHAAVPRVFPFYNKVKLKPDALRFFPAWKSRRAEGTRQEEKTVLPLAELHQASLSFRSAPLTGIVFPTVPAADTLTQPCLKPLDRGEALRLLAPSSLLQLPTGGAQAFARLAAVVRQLPCWQLQLTPDTARVSALLSELISSAP